MVHFGCCLSCSMLPESRCTPHRLTSKESGIRDCKSKENQISSIEHRAHTVAHPCANRAKSICCHTKPRDFKFIAHSIFLANCFWPATVKEERRCSSQCDDCVLERTSASIQLSVFDCGGGCDCKENKRWTLIFVVWSANNSTQLRG